MIQEDTMMIIKRYNGPVTYALDNANFDFMIQIGGAVSDSDGDDLEAAGVLTRILGDRATGEHMVNTDVHTL